MKDEYIRIHPGPKSRAIVQRDKRVISPSLTREYDLVFEKARGCNVWDADGRKYLDFASSVAVMNIGYSNQSVLHAIFLQAKMGTHCGFSDFFAETPVRLAEVLVSMMPGGLDTVFFSNSGAEAVEAAFKCARWHSKKKWFIAFKPCFHGRTMGALSMTNSRPVQRERFSPFLPVKHVSYPYLYRSGFDSEQELSGHCLDRVEKTIKSLKGNAAGIMFEPIAGEGGYIVPPKSFVKGLRRLCNEHNVLLCCDEVQSGCFRTGEFLAMENFGVKADIVCLSKAIGGGLPLGATVASKKIMDWQPGTHASTFGGNLVACAAGIATLDFMKRKKLGRNAKRVGKAVMKRLEEIQEKSSIVGEVRGMGLMIGVEIVKNKKDKVFGIKERKSIMLESIKNGLILLGAGENSIRISPPLIISEDEAMHGLGILEESIRATEREMK